jgi:hypothetical protein
MSFSGLSGRRERERCGVVDDGVVVALLNANCH